MSQPDLTDMARAPEAIQREMLERARGMQHSAPWQYTPSEVQLLQETERLKKALAAKESELAHMRLRLVAADERAQRVAPVVAELGKALKALIVLAHPDRWPDTPLAHEITIALNQLRERLR